MTEEQLRNWIKEQYTQMLPELLDNRAQRERMNYLIEQAYEQRCARCLGAAGSGVTKS